MHNAMNPTTHEEMPLDCVRAALIVRTLGFSTCYASQSVYVRYRDAEERAFDTECMRAINACKTPGDNF